MVLFVKKCQAVDMFFCRPYFSMYPNLDKCGQSDVVLYYHLRSHHGIMMMRTASMVNKMVRYA